MFKEGMQDQQNKLDEGLIGLVTVKKRVKEVIFLLVLDKMRCKLVFKTPISFTAPKTKDMVKQIMGRVLDGYPAH